MDFEAFFQIALEARIGVNICNKLLEVKRVWHRIKIFNFNLLTFKFALLHSGKKWQLQMDVD